MNFLKVISTAFFALLIAACDHPIEIVGEGDVTSASGKRNCYLEDYRTGKENCTKNTVVGEYNDTYYATPRDGWTFDKWEGCGDQRPDCTLNIPASGVGQFWGQVMPPLTAVFIESDPIETLKPGKIGWPLESPAESSRITQPYACYDCIKEDPNRYHIGIDMKGGVFHTCLSKYKDEENEILKTEEDCMEEGRVVAIEDVSVCEIIENGIGDKGFGNSIIVKHEPSDRFFMYSHLLEFAPDIIKESALKRGDLVGYIGGTGSGIRRKFPPHLHFQVLQSCGLPSDLGYTDKHPKLRGYADPWPMFSINIIDKPIGLEGVREDILGIRNGPSSVSEFMSPDVREGQQFVAYVETASWYLIDIPCGHKSGLSGTDKACSGWVKKKAPDKCRASDKSCVVEVENPNIFRVSAENSSLFVREFPGTIFHKVADTRFWEGQYVVAREGPVEGSDEPGNACASDAWYRIDLPKDPGLSVEQGWICSDYLETVHADGEVINPDLEQPAFKEGDPGTVGDGLLIEGTSYAIGFLRTANRYTPDPRPFLPVEASTITLTVYGEAPSFGFESYIFFGLNGDQCDPVLHTINTRVTELDISEPTNIIGVYGEVDVAGLLGDFEARGCSGSASDLYIRQVQVSAFFGGDMPLDAFAIGIGKLKVLEYSLPSQ